MNQDLWMLALDFHGFGLLEFISSEKPDRKNYFVRRRYSILNFIRNKKDMIFKTHESSRSLKDSVIPAMPIEMFQNLRPDERRDLYFDSIERGSVVLLRVIHDGLEDKFRCLILCKEAECMKMDDLRMAVYLPRLQEELNLAGGQVQDFDILRAAICSVNIDKREMYVTLDNRLLQDSDIQLGKVPKEEVPPYVGEVEFPESYVDYLESLPEFFKPEMVEEIYSVLGLSKKEVYSYYEDLDGMTFPDEDCAVALKEEKDKILSMEKYQKGLVCYEKSNFTEAFNFFNKALSIYPDNVEALVSRGILYSNINKLKHAVRDTEYALKLNPKHPVGRQQMSILLVNAARKHVELGNFEQAKEALNSACQLDSENQEIAVVLSEIQMKYLGHWGLSSSECIVDPEKISTQQILPFHSSQNHVQKLELSSPSQIQKDFDLRSYLNQVQKPELSSPSQIQKDLRSYLNQVQKPENLPNSNLSQKLKPSTSSQTQKLKMLNSSLFQKLQLPNSHYSQKFELSDSSVAQKPKLPSLVSLPCESQKLKLPSSGQSQKLKLPSSGQSQKLKLPSSSQSKKPKLHNSIQSQNMKSLYYKTIMCRSFVMGVFCKFGSQCQFAHGKDELRSAKGMVKTIIPCRTFCKKGSCPFGAKCHFAHGKDEQHSAKGMVKTIIPCRAFCKKGSCPLGTKCHFAHGKDKLHSKKGKFKTVPCRTFRKKGSCPFGAKCLFIHDYKNTKKCKEKETKIKPEKDEEKETENAKDCGVIEVVLKSDEELVEEDEMQLNKKRIKKGTLLEDSTGQKMKKHCATHSKDKKHHHHRHHHRHHKLPKESSAVSISVTVPPNLTYVKKSTVVPSNLTYIKKADT